MWQMLHDRRVAYPAETDDPSGMRWAGRLAAAAGVAALLIGALAMLDHSWKNRRMEGHYVDTWYCEYRGIRCDRPQVTTMERHWQQREIVYRILFGIAAYSALGAAAVAAAGQGRRPGWRLHPLGRLDTD